MLGTSIDDKLKLKLLLLYLLKKRGASISFSYFFFYFFRTNLDAPSIFFRAPSFFLKTHLDLGLEDHDEFFADDEEPEEDPCVGFGSRRTFCRNLLYFFGELPSLAAEEGCDQEETEAFRRLASAKSKQMNLLSRVMHEHKVDPLEIVQD